MHTEADLKDSRRAENLRQVNAKHHEAMMQEWGDRLYGLGRAISRAPQTGVLYTEIRVKLVGNERGEYLAVVKAVKDDEPVVAFVGGPGPLEALLAACALAGAGGLRWRPDRAFDSVHRSGDRT